MLKHRGKIKEILNVKGYYALLFVRRHSFYNTELKKKDSKTYDFIVGVYGKNAQKIISNEIIVGQSVVIQFRVESFKPDENKGHYKVFHSVICENIETIEEVRQIKEQKMIDADHKFKDEHNIPYDK